MYKMIIRKKVKLHLCHGETCLYCTFLSTFEYKYPYLFMSATCVSLVSTLLRLLVDIIRLTFLLLLYMCMINLELFSFNLKKG